MVQFIWQIRINLLVFLLSILIIQRGQKKLTPLEWFTAWRRQSIVSLGGKARFCIWDGFYSAVQSQKATSAYL